MKQMAMVILVCVLLCLPLSTVTSHNLENNPANSATEDDIELYIWGGPYLLLNQGITNESPIGFIIRVVNNEDNGIYGHCSIRIRYRLNPVWNITASLPVYSHSERDFHFVFEFPFALLTVRATVENKTLIRSGFMIMGFTVFLTRSEIEHSEMPSKYTGIQDINRCNFLHDGHSPSLLW